VTLRQQRHRQTKPGQQQDEGNFIAHRRIPERKASAALTALPALVAPACRASDLKIDEVRLL
jgi:hypothetical protein